MFCKKHPIKNDHTKRIATQRETTYLPALYFSLWKVKKALQEGMLHYLRVNRIVETPPVLYITTDLIYAAIIIFFLSIVIFLVQLILLTVSRYVCVHEFHLR
jgi:hypothetical protein